MWAYFMYLGQGQSRTWAEERDDELWRGEKSTWRPPTECETAASHRFHCGGQPGDHHRYRVCLYAPLPPPKKKRLWVCDFGTPTWGFPVFVCAVLDLQKKFEHEREARQRAERSLLEEEKKSSTLSLDLNQSKKDKTTAEQERMQNTEKVTLRLRIQFLFILRRDDSRMLGSLAFLVPSDIKRILTLMLSRKLVFLMLSEVFRVWQLWHWSILSYVLDWVLRAIPCSSIARDAVGTGENKEIISAERTEDISATVESTEGNEGPTGQSQC